jgi:hypothetical protein
VLSPSTNVNKLFMVFLKVTAEAGERSILDLLCDETADDDGRGIGGVLKLQAFGTARGVLAIFRY